MKIIIEKTMKIIILKRNIHENHHYKKPMNIIILKRKIYETHHSKNINEHHHFEEENP